MNYNNTITILLKIDDLCTKINETIKNNGNDFNKFKENEDYRDLVSWRIFNIGELAVHLDDEYKKSTNNLIPWRQIISMRNYFAHGYFNMDIRTIYDTAIIDIPKLQANIKEQIKILMKNNKE